jgi:hypothetical protein
MANKGQVNLDRVLATSVGPIYSVYHDAELQNGYVCNLGALKSGERELYAVATPATASLGTEEIVLIASPEVMYNAATDDVRAFAITAGDAARAYGLKVGDTVTITDAVLTGTTEVGKYLVPANASLKLAAAADLTGATRFAGKVIEKGTLNGEASTTFRVIKA